MTLPRSIYAERLRDFADFAFGEERAFEHRGGWRDFFGKRIGPTFDGRVILDVGCFDAAYLSRIAARFPNTAFVGLDWKCKALHDGAQRIAGLGLCNVALLRARGQDVLKVFSPLEVDEVWVFHPDPCAREVELKNRLIGERFLMDVHQVLRADTSTLSLKTDHPGYYQWVLGLLGLPEPEWFRVACDPATSHQSTPPVQRVRTRDLMPREKLPNANEAIRACFDVTMNSADYWHDSAALAHSVDRCFAGEVTLFESRFVKKRLPIYYLEMRKK